MPRPFVIAIAGASGSGKTTLARRLAGALGTPDVAVVPVDAYYRDRPSATPGERAAANYDAPDAIEASLLESHLTLLRAGRTVERPVYDFGTHRRTRAIVPVRPGRYLVVEGILALHWPGLRALYDMTVFIEIDKATALARRLARDTRERGRDEEPVRRQWRLSVWPMFLRHVAPTRRLADLTVDGAAPIEACAEQLVAAVRTRRASGEKR